MMLSSISRNGLLLAVFALVSVGAIAVVNYFTRPIIESEMEAALARTLNELVPPEAYNNDVYTDCFLAKAPDYLGTSKALPVYRMRDDGEPVAVILNTVAPDGYSGRIKLTVGIYADGSLAGVRVAQHNETPGLGDKIEPRKSDWILQFEGLSLQKPNLKRWRVKKDGGVFDAFTGATITPRAVLKALRNTQVWFAKNKQQVFAAPTNCSESAEQKEATEYKSESEELKRIPDDTPAKNDDTTTNGRKQS